jgi:trans-aconitate 2-methyltransferase
VAWNPDQYGRFRDERAQPFRDLLALVQPRPGMRVADLGCGTGELTLELHRALGARETLGLDSSASMLAKAPQAPGLRFEEGDIAEFAPAQPFDLIFSNAALHWLPDHPTLLRRLTAALSPGGQLAVQMPMNDEHPSHQTAYDLARSREFRRLLGGYERREPLLEPVQYAAWLHRLGFVLQQVRTQIYSHLLDDRAQVIEWNRGALLTEYQKRLKPADWEKFLARYREMLLPQLEDEHPYLYTYPRILIWGLMPDQSVRS